MTKQKLKARDNSRNLPSNLKVSGFRQTTKRKQGVFEKTTGHTLLSLQCKHLLITIVYFAINICLKIHLHVFRTKIEHLPTIIPSFCYFCSHPVLHRADNPHVWLYTVNLITNIKSFDFSTLYTTIPHQELKNRLASIIRNSFLHKNGNRRYKYLVLGREGPCFVKEHSDSKSKYTEEDIIKMLESLVDNIFVVFAGKAFQQIIGIPVGTTCAPLLADLFLY